MYGFAAISQANGWAMAGAGAGIVLSGLTVLCILISFFPRLIHLFDEKEKTQIDATPEKESTPEITAFVFDLAGESASYSLLTEGLGDSFTLIDLHLKAKEAGKADPHLSITRFREAGLLVPVGDEHFAWQNLPIE